VWAGLVREGRGRERGGEGGGEGWGEGGEGMSDAEEVEGEAAGAEQRWEHTGAATTRCLPPPTAAQTTGTPEQPARLPATQFMTSSSVCTASGLGAASRASETSKRASERRGSVGGGRPSLP